jgi:hypothetical protein
VSKFHLKSQSSQTNHFETIPKTYANSQQICKNSSFKFTLLPGERKRLWKIQRNEVEEQEIEKREGEKLFVVSETLFTTFHPFVFQHMKTCSITCNGGM